MTKETALTDAQIADKLKSLPGWKYEAGAISPASTRPTAGQRLSCW